MKKIHYLLTLLGAAMAFTSCNPLDKTYKTLDANPTPTTTSYTLLSSDYALAGSTAPGYKTHSYSTYADANASIPTILNSKFPNNPNGSSISVSFIQQPVLADSVFKDESYTLINLSDYLLLPNNKFADFSVAQILTWLPYKYTAPVANQMYVLNWIFYPTLSATAPQIYPGVALSTTGTVTTAVGSFIYINGAWTQAYHITPAQYAAVGRGQYNQFTSADDAQLPSFFNGILKADPSFASPATGTVQYVSYNYYNAAKATDQRVMAMTYNGSNWVTGATNSLIFVKANGVWTPDPSIYYTLTTADTKLIGNPTGTNNQTIGTVAQRANLYQYGDFSGWAVADLDNAMILALQTDFPNPKVNIPYKVTFLLYSGKDVPTTYIFTYNGTTWVAAQ